MTKRRHRYHIELKPAAYRDLAKIGTKNQKQLGRRIDALAENPRPRGAKKLETGSNLHRIRCGDYRIIYQIRDDIRLVLVLRVRHRRDAYRRI